MHNEDLISHKETGKGEIKGITWHKNRKLEENLKQKSTTRLKIFRQILTSVHIQFIAVNYIKICKLHFF